MSRCSSGDQRGIGKKEIVDHRKSIQLLDFKEGDTLFLKEKEALGEGKQERADQTGGKEKAREYRCF